MWWPFKKTSQDALIQSFEIGSRSAQVSLCKKVASFWSVPVGEEPATVLVAQVVNYLMGQDIVAVMQGSTEPLRSQIARIKDQVPARAANAMTESKRTREVVVATLRMREVLEFMMRGESYVHSGQHKRIESLLSTYGPEFPEEITPERFLAIVHRYHQDNFGRK